MYLISDYLLGRFVNLFHLRRRCLIGELTRTSPCVHLDRPCLGGDFGGKMVRGRQRVDGERGRGLIVLVLRLGWGVHGRLLHELLICQSLLLQLLLEGDFFAGLILQDHVAVLLEILVVVLQRPATPKQHKENDQSRDQENAEDSAQYAADDTAVVLGGAGNNCKETLETLSKARRFSYQWCSLC
jgi:hypothetical protein